ncbi:hypothetical protein PHLCEN_2v9090, partial [Hermanssonia centrifuga]
CQDAHITWTEGQGPFNLIVVPSDDPCNEVLADLGDHAGQSMTWHANLAAGTAVMLSLEDATGAEAWSGSITIGGSSDASCLPAVSSAVSSLAASSSAISSLAASSTAVSPDASTTALVVPATYKAAPAASSASAALPATSSGAVAVGAANAGDNPNFINGAAAFHKFSASAVAMTALAAVFVVAL